MEFTILYCHNTASCIGNANAHTGILHSAGNSYILILLADVLHSLQRLHKARRGWSYLPIGQGLTRTDRIAVADLPWRNTEFMGHLGECHLHGVAGLGHTKASECTCRRVIGIVRPTGDLEIVVVIRSCGVCARALQHRTAQRGVRTGIGDDLRLDALNQAIVVAAHGDGHLHGMPFGVDENTFLTSELHLHGPTGEIGNERGMVLHGHVLLTSEAAAHQHIGHMDLLSGNTQHNGCLPGGVIGALIRG